MKVHLFHTVLRMTTSFSGEPSFPPDAAAVGRVHSRQCTHALAQAHAVHTHSSAHMHACTHLHMTFIVPSQHLPACQVLGVKNQWPGLSSETYIPSNSEKKMRSVSLQPKIYLSCSILVISCCLEAGPPWLKTLALHGTTSGVPFQLCNAIFSSSAKSTRCEGLQPEVQAPIMEYVTWTDFDILTLCFSFLICETGILATSCKLMRNSNKRKYIQVHPKIYNTMETQDLITIIFFIAIYQHNFSIH